MKRFGAVMLAAFLFVGIELNAQPPDLPLAAPRSKAGQRAEARTVANDGAKTTGAVNYGRPFEPPTRPAFITLPPGAVEPAGWLRDWCLAARDGYTGHMDEPIPGRGTRRSPRR